MPLLVYRTSHGPTWACSAAAAGRPGAACGRARRTRRVPPTPPLHRASACRAPRPLALPSDVRAWRPA